MLPQEHGKGMAPQGLSLPKFGLRSGTELGLEFRLGSGSSQMGLDEDYLGSLLISEGP